MLMLWAVQWREGGALDICSGANIWRWSTFPVQDFLHKSCWLQKLWNWSKKMYQDSKIQDKKYCTQIQEKHRKWPRPCNRTGNQSKQSTGRKVQAGGHRHSKPAPLAQISLLSNHNFLCTLNRGVFQKWNLEGAILKACRGYDCTWVSACEGEMGLQWRHILLKCDDAAHFPTNQPLVILTPLCLRTERC